MPGSMHIAYLIQQHLKEIALGTGSLSMFLTTERASHAIFNTYSVLQVKLQTNKCTPLSFADGDL